MQQSEMDGRVNCQQDCEDELMAENEVLKERNKLDTRCLKKLLKQKSQLSALNESLSDRAFEQTAQLEKIKEKYGEIINHAAKDTESVVSELWDLNQVIKDLLVIHSKQPDQNQETFPSKLSPNEYFKAEEEFTSSLTAYTKRQFFEGIAEMSGAKDKLRYEILEVNNPESLLIKGETEEILKNKCKELARLQSVYTKSQMNRSESYCNLRKVQACLYKMEENLSKIAIEQPEFDTEYLSSRITKLQHECEKEGRELNRVYQDELLPLVEEMSDLQSTKILSGNFDLKIARQNYFISKQDMVIDQLLLQNSRYELLSMLYEVEAKTHRETYHLLSTAKSLLNEENTTLEDRLSELVSYTQKKPPRETLDSRDVFMQNLYKAIEDEAKRLEQKHFVTCEMLKSNFEEFMSNQKNSMNTKHDVSQRQFVDRLRKKMTQCAAYVHKLQNPDITGDGQEKMSQNIARIEDVLQTLEKSVKGAITDIDRKKKMIATDSLKAMDRTIFSNFFNDPTRLQRIMAELKTRVEAIGQ